MQSVNKSLMEAKTNLMPSLVFPNFVVRDPEDVFREFFGGRDPFEDLFDRK